MSKWSVILDGHTGFIDYDGNSQSWYGNGIPYLGAWQGGVGKTLNATVELTGTDWWIDMLNIGAAEDATANLTLTDLDDGAERFIRYLRIGDNATVDLISTEVKHIYGDDGTLHEVKLGEASTVSVQLEADVNKLTTGAGYVGLINTGGADRVVVNSGGAGLVETGDMKDTVIVKGGGVEAIHTGDQTDKVTLMNDARVQSLDTGRGRDIVLLDGADAQSVSLGSGNDKITLKNGAYVAEIIGKTGTDTVIARSGSWVEFMDLTGGSGDVRLFGNAGTDAIELGEGSDTISSESGGIGSILAFGSEATLDIGDFAGSITAYDAGIDLHIESGASVPVIHLSGAHAGRHRIVADGSFGSLQVWGDGADVTIGSESCDSLRLGDSRDTVKTGAGWVDFIATNGGNDVVRIGSGGAATVRTGAGDDVVRTGPGYVELLNTGDGDDTVTLGSGVLGHLRLGNGDDYVAVRETDPAYGDILWGGDGTDTIDFSAFAVGVTVDLDFNGWQDIGATPAGFFQFMGLENATGTARADTLIGDGAANVLRGLGGGDRLIGGGGSDRLIGHAGADVLKAGNGADRLLGGSGNDKLTGGGGVDIFVFAANAGTDTVTDFKDGTDLLRIADHAGGFAGLDIADSGSDLKIVHDSGIIILEDLAGTVLGADDFDFV